MDGRKEFQSYSHSIGTAGEGRKNSKADGFNRSIQRVHVKAIDHLKSLGFSTRAIEDSLQIDCGNKA